MMHAGIVVFGRKRPGFDQEWGKHIESAVRQAFSGAEHPVTFREAHVVDEATLGEALSAFSERGVDVAVVLQPTMSDGRLAVRFAQQWGRPIVLWATPERPGTPKVSSCSLVGTHVFGANLRQHSLPFELVYGAPEDPETLRELEVAMRVCYAEDRMQDAKVGLIGYHAPGFIDMHADPFDLAGHFGALLWHTGIQELLDRMQAVTADEVNDDLAAVNALGLAMEDIETADLEQNARFYVAVKTLFQEERLDALALREWPELPNLTGSWPYLAIARLLDEGLPVACEGDVDGALTSLIGSLLGLGTGYLSDWLAHDEETVTLWHGGCAPLSLCAPASLPEGPRVGRHFNSNKPAVVNAVIPAGKPLTLCRVWRCDGVYQMLVEEGITVPPVQVLEGTTGRIRFEDMDVREWFRELCHAGMPHHVVAFPGNAEEKLCAFARLAQLELF